MYLENISITQFKNLEQADLVLSPQLNCFVGYNGSGKTNILDAIHFLSLTKSGLMSTDARCVHHDSDFYILKGHYLSMDRQNPQTVSVSFQSGRGKKVMFGGKKYNRISEHIGRFPLVMITPSDSVLISDSADNRRKFINTFFSQFDGNYLSLLMKYNGVLQQRNALLKQAGLDTGLLEIISDQLSDLAHQIYDLRAAYVAELAPIVTEYYRTISGEREGVEVQYKSSLSKGLLADILRERFERDVALGYTATGVHRDDVIFTMDGHPIRNFGSQGQQKSLLIAIKLAEAKITSHKSGKSVILLLDDIFDKLDTGRIENLVGLVSSEQIGQIFITDASKTKLKQIIEKFDTDYKIFEVDGGRVTEQEE